MCQHLYPYSVAGRGKTDHPPVFSPQANWFGGFRTFNDYFARLGYIVGETKDVYEAGILHPQREIWLEYIRSEDYESVKETEDAFDELLLRLRKRGITYHFIDESLLAKYGSAENGVLRVGRCAYRTVIVPQMRTLAPETYALLQKYTGKLCVLGEVEYIGGEKRDVSLRSDTALEEILEKGRFGYACEDGRSVLTARRGELGEFVFIKNLSRTEKSRVRLAGAAENYEALDLENLKTYPLDEDNITLSGAESLILVKSAAAHPAEKEITERDVTERFRVADITENYLVLDYAQMARGEAPFGERRPISGMFEELLREDYKGELRVRQTFVLREKMPLSLILEKAEFTSVQVNGNPVQFTQSAFDVNFVEAQIGGAVREGENELIYNFHFWQHEGVRFALFDPLATESLRNCLYYDTSIEPAYLKGRFAVEKDFSLSQRRALPPLTDELYAEGYPFFKGELVLQGGLEYSGSGKAVLALEGRFAEAEVQANGKSIGIALDTEKDISPVLRKGKNDITIVLRSSLRNLFGPHHYKIPEPMSVSPYNFEFRGEWKNGNPADYTDEYHSVPFGVRKILCTF